MFAQINSSKSYPEPEKQRQKAAILTNIMKVMNIVGVLLLVYGNKYVKAVLDLLFSGKYSQESCVTAMKLFILYIYFCGINGITEAYVYGCLSEKQMGRFKRYVYFSFV